MAIYYLQADVVKRSVGYSAVAASAYAAGMDLYDERADKLEKYGQKRGVYHTEIVAPDHAPDWAYNRQELWNRAELAEKRVDAQPARVFVLALPHELTDTQNIALVTGFAREVLASEGMVVDIGFHRAHEEGDQRNDHAHLVMTMRELAGDDFSSKKQREWNRKEKLEYWREQWADYQNDALEDAGFDARVDHRTLENQGIDRKPTVHMGKNATAMEREGIATDIGDKNREIAEQNRMLEERLREQAVIDAEMSQELAEALSDTKPEPMPVERASADPSPPPDFSFPTAQSSQPEPPLALEERKRDPQSAFTSEVTQAYMMQGAPSPGERAESERRWYDSFYSTIETAQHYVSRFVDRVAFWRSQRDAGDYDRER